MISRIATFNRYLSICIMVLIAMVADVSAAKAKARVTDVSGRTYDMASLQLERAGWFGMTNNKLAVVCGGARMEVAFKQISNMKIDPGQIIAVDGQPFFGVEIRTRGGDVIGNVMESEQCFVGATGLTGKTVQKSRYRASFGSLMNVQFFGKGEDAGNRRGEDDEEDDEDED